ncbi:hypothetical protein [Arthrobacter sp. SAFR-014]|uniref:hypothetical protein n=1 Tax=unclassified Arthrobacter TaxID=235627 RepID=UPI003F7BBE87
MLDSNVWRYLVDADGVEQVRRAAKSRVQIVACPAVAFEALRGNDAVVRRKLAKAMTEGAWTRLMPEAYTEAAELHQAISKHRPDWLLPSPDMRQWYRLQSDWKHGWWQRARHDVAGEAERINSLDHGRLQAARAASEFLRQDALTNGVTFEKINFDQRVSFQVPRDGWDGLPFDAWRAEGMFNWWEELFPRRHSSAYFEWMTPRLKVDLIATQRAEWVTFWTRDASVNDLPRQWIRWALNYAQRTRKTTPGTAVDNQIGVYMADCDYFVTSDKALIDCIDKIRDVSPVPLASCRRLPGGPGAVPALLNVIEECAAR